MHKSQLGMNDTLETIDYKPKIISVILIKNYIDIIFNKVSEMYKES